MAVAGDNGRGERAVVDAQGHLLAVEDVEHVEDVHCASYEADNPEVCTVSPGLAQVSSSRNFGRWSGWRRLEVPGSSSKTTGSSIPASSRTRFCRAVDC